MRSKMKCYAAALAVICAFGAAGAGMSGCSSDSTSESVSYTAYSTNELMDDFSQNALNAADKYEGQYVELTGILNSIDSDGTYITLHREDGEWTLEGVMCYLMNDEQKSAAASLTKGSLVTVKGKITRVDETFAYYLNIDELSEGGSSSSSETDIGDNSENGKVEYTVYSLIDMMEETVADTDSAEDKYKGQYVELTGYVYQIDSGGSYINLAPTNEDFDPHVLKCMLDGDEQESFAKSSSEDDLVTVKGKISSVDTNLLGGGTIVIKTDEISVASLDEYRESNNIEYTVYSIDEMCAAAIENEAAAEGKYVDQYVEITGYIDSLDSTAVTLKANYYDDDDLYYDWNEIYCYIRDDAQLEFVQNASVGEQVTIRGKVSSLYSYSSYATIYVDLDEILY